MLLGSCLWMYMLPYTRTSSQGGGNEILYVLLLAKLLILGNTGWKDSQLQYENVPFVHAQEAICVIYLGEIF